MTLIRIQTELELLERGFTLHRLFKYRLSSRLRVVTLDSLLRVSVLCPRDIATFDVAAAVGVMARRAGPSKGLCLELQPFLCPRFFRR
jgi:hypothetical protein